MRAFLLFLAGAAAMTAEKGLAPCTGDSLIS